MPLVINSLGDGDTHTHTHTDIVDKSNFKKPVTHQSKAGTPGFKSGENSLVFENVKFMQQ